jgi:hypothetical protein
MQSSTIALNVVAGGTTKNTFPAIPWTSEMNAQERTGIRIHGLPSYYSASTCHCEHGCGFPVPLYGCRSMAGTFQV